MTNAQFVSIHGGHSGEFCSHAKNTLEEVILAYIDKGFSWVGITEHAPPVSTAFIYPDEKDAGMNIFSVRSRFADYMKTGRDLQARYKDQIRIFIGFETETCSGGIAYAQALLKAFSPDYIVGSVHHVKDIPFDYSKDYYREAADRCGGLDALYRDYFDEQYKMIETLAPRVVGHFDIIRIHDADYRARIINPSIWEKVVRNLKLIKKLNLILDFNLRPLTRGESEPYLSGPILDMASEMGIEIVPGDDSHGVDTIGKHLPAAIELLRAAGVNINWQEPVNRLN